MVRTLFRTLLLIVIVVAIAAFFIGYRWATPDRASDTDPVVGTSGRAVDVENARDTGAKIGQRVAEGANQAQRLASAAALTAKIKAKMALDDTIQASAIDVDSSDGVVTLSGTVGSTAERERAVRLARETEGVTRVVDLLTIH